METSFNQVTLAQRNRGRATQGALFKNALYKRAKILIILDNVPSIRFAFISRQ